MSLVKFSLNYLFILQYISIDSFMLSTCGFITVLLAVQCACIHVPCDSIHQFS